MMKEQDGKGDEEYEKLKDLKSVELEERRRLMEIKSEKKRRLCQLHIERKKETETEEFRRAKEAVGLKSRELERTERLAKELARRKHIELRESIKILKARSAASYISDEALEKLQAELAKEKEREKEAIESSTLPSPWNMKEDSIIEREERKLNYRRDLQRQIIDSRRRLREKEEEKHRERKIMEEVQDVMHKENLQAEKRKKETAALLQAERDAFLKARQFWKEKRREVLKQEHDEISRIVAKREAVQKREAEGKTDARAAKDAALEKLMNKLMEDERKRIEREELSRELYLAERESEMAKEEIKLAMEKKRTARKLQQDMASNQKAMADKKAKEDAIDVAFAKYLADERKKHEEKERVKKESRREKVIQYGNELREMMEKSKMQRSKDASLMQFGMTAKDEKRQIKCFSESTLHTLKAEEARNSLC